MPHDDEIRHVERVKSSGAFYAFGRLVCRLYFATAHGVRVFGQSNIPKGGAAIVAANHVSFLDPLVLGVGPTRQIHFMADIHFFRLPLLGCLMRESGAFSVDPKRGDRDALSEGIEVLKDGHVLGIFPEGARSTDGQLQRFKGGVAMMAVRAGVPVVPTSISGAFDAWPRHRLLPRPRKIEVRYHPPIDPRMVLRECRGDKKAARRKLLELLRSAISAGLAETPLPR